MSHSRSFVVRTTTMLCLSVLLPLTGTAAHAQPAAEQAATRDFRLAPGTLGSVLAQFATQAGVRLSFGGGMVQGLQSPGLNGSYTVEAGFAALLSGTGLSAVRAGANEYTLSAAAAPVAQLEAVTVTAAYSGGLMPAFAGNQVASGASAGMLGEKSIMDTPFSITAYTSALMQQQQAQSVADVVSNDASVQNTNPRTSRFDQFSIRGFPVLNSDIALNGLYSVLPTYALAVESLERVEVLKGPNALLNGMPPSGGVGGAINVVPKRAGDTPTRQVTASYGTDDVAGGHVDLGQRFGDKGELGIRVNGAYKGGDTGVGSQHTTRGLMTLGMDYRGERTRWSVDVGHQDRKVDAPQERVGVAAAAPVPDARRVDRGYAPDWTYSNSRDSYIALRAEYDVTDSTMVYGAFGARDGDYKFLRMNVTVRDAAGNFGSSPSYFLRDENVQTGEIGARTRFATGAISHSVAFSATQFEKTFGNLSYDFAPVQSNLFSPLPTTAPSLAGLSSDIPRSGKSRLTSIALADTLSAWDERVQLTVGGRSQRVVTDQYDESGSLTSRYDERKITPAIALLGKPSQHVSLYANYVEGLSEGPTAPLTAVNANTVFAPIKSKQIEAGVKVEYGDVGATLSAFQIRRPSGLTDPVTGIYSVNGMQRNRGLELNVFGEPVSNVRLLAGLMYLDGRLTKTGNALTEGNVAPGTPRYSMNAGVEWDTPFLPGLTVTARALRTTSQYLDAANNKEIPGWTRVDVGARYAFRAGNTPVTLRATVENVFNKAYWASASSNGLTIGAPRTVLLSATVDF
ncbi:TonB-dependent siderophore receptor [Achromobacter xylosoxidans C54]|uniref:TonB-dependent receptor n=2 Tax=Alcaligenaceae TaxID=506 RepID=UPI0001F43D18|nr:TonB-dependent receptor [Achromobacter dolens]EFV87756.1 TonB-dependent siderophore receptor [Achromobacter xylosoxidans C54]MCZ8410927.1 TonB-dependent receptor [Achromobacter dolens]